MQSIDIRSEALTQGTKILSGSSREATLCLPAGGGGLSLPQLITCTERYLTFNVEALGENSVALIFNFYSKQSHQSDPGFDIRFGILPRICTKICIDLHWTDAHVLFPETTPGQLKVVCHGGRIAQEDTARVELVNCPCLHDLQVRFSEITLTDVRPEEYPLPDEKLIDEMGQYKKKNWPNKVQDAAQLRQRLNALDGGNEGYPFADWSEYGGWKQKKLTEGSRFFSRIKEDGRWWLVDPLGCAFFSMGPDGVVARSDCRIDGVEKWMDWLPARDDARFGKMYKEQNWPRFENSVRNCTLFSFEQANLFRAFGDDWYRRWMSIMKNQLMKNGLNTLGNWSDEYIQGKLKIPYVTMLPEFPRTRESIFRDFPDVFSEQYRESAAACAQALRVRRDDPYMIGYFLRNEPSWAFVDNLVIADEVFFNPARTACRERLVALITEKYGTVQALNAAWNKSFDHFDELYGVHRNISKWSRAANADMREFSRLMLDAYVAIPSAACRAVDPNHMILGMRWAWISDPDVVTGWENFDVFSINCYAVDPTPALEHVRELGVDLPIMIGEFHFGALDAGLTSTGLEGVASQKDRGIAYRYYCEQVAAHPNGVGCHYFQCYDQFALGRFDGENYNIGLFDICSQPYPEMMRQVRECGRDVYQVASGEKPPVKKMAETVPVVAF